MQRRTIIALLAGLLPLGIMADEEPLWEVMGRLNAGTDDRVGEWVRQIFTWDGSPEMTGDKAIFRIAAFENPETAEEDWVAEIRGLSDAGELLGKIEAVSRPDAEGRFLIEENGVSFLIWREGESTFRLASPPVNSGVTVNAKTVLGEDAWISGWVDLERLGGGAIESKSLKLPRSLGFTASLVDNVIGLEVVAELKADELVSSTKRVIEELRAELMSKAEGGTEIPPVQISAEGKQLVIKTQMTSEQLERILTETAVVLEKP